MTETNVTPESLPLAPPAHVPQWSYGEGIVTIVPEPAGLNESQAPVELYSHAAKWVRGAGPGYEEAPTTALYGPIGKQRNIPTMILLSIVTLGIYPIYWYGKINTEMRDFDPRTHARSTWSRLALSIPWLLSAVVVIAAGAYYLATVNHLDTTWIGYSLTNKDLLVLATAPLLAGLASVVIPFTVVSLVATGARVKTIEDRVGTRADKQLRPAAMLWAMIVPIVGWWTVMCRLQIRLNRAWSSTTGPG